MMQNTSFEQWWFHNFVTTTDLIKLEHLTVSIVKKLSYSYFYQETESTILHIVELYSALLAEEDILCFTTQLCIVKK